MVTGDVELVHECFPKHLRVGTCSKHKQTEGEIKNRGLCMERSKVGTKKKSRRLISTLSKYNNNQHNIW